MDSSGRIHMFREMQQAVDEMRTRERVEVARLRDTGVVTQWPMPEQCDARKVLAALEKLENVRGEVLASDAVLLPLTPFDRGYVLGLREYMAWRREHP